MNELDARELREAGRSPIPPTSIDVAMQRAYEAQQLVITDSVPAEAGTSSAVAERSDLNSRVPGADPSTTRGRSHTQPGERERPQTKGR